jgi:hypothetical protein
MGPRAMISVQIRIEDQRTLQSEYRQWLENLPEAFCESPVAEKLEEVCSLDLESLATVDLPRGWGRD